MSLKTKDKIALVFGSTGLIGRELTNLLLQDERYEMVKVFTRKPLEIVHPKLIQIIDDLSNPERITEDINGDDLFCCLGTTMKKAGSKKAFEWPDLELPVKIASLAANHGVNKFLVISSIGADPHSSNFYLRTKGLMEKGVIANAFHQINILRPSILIGKRNESRAGEEIGKTLMGGLSFLFLGPLKKFKPIHATTVARAMIRLANSLTTLTIVESNEIQELGK